MEPNATTVYYTFSTIAQTLAAIVAILAAFAVVRLSDLATRLRDQLRSLAGHCQYPELFYASLTEGDFEGAMGQIPEDSLGGGDDHLVMMGCARTALERERILSALWLSFVIAGLVIAFSIANLIFAEAITTNGTRVWVFLILGFIGLLICLMVVGRLVARLAPGRLQKNRRPRRISKTVA